MEPFSQNKKDERDPDLILQTTKTYEYNKTQNAPGHYSDCGFFQHWLNLGKSEKILSESS